MYLCLSHHHFDPIHFPVSSNPRSTLAIPSQNLYCLFVFFIFGYQDIVSLHGNFETLSVDQSSLKLTQIHLPLLPGAAGIKRCAPPMPSMCILWVLSLRQGSL